MMAVIARFDRDILDPQFDNPQVPRETDLVGEKVDPTNSYW
jgi:hypothetical protein